MRGRPQTKTVIEELGSEDHAKPLVDTVVESAASQNLNTKGAALLTKQEKGVVRLVAEGLKNREIARQLNLSENTVRNYMFRIFDKLGTSNRVELALYAVRQQI